MKHISVTDTTIRQAGKAAGYTLSFREKIELAKLLDRLGVSVIELHAVENPKIDSLLIKSVASAVKESAVCVPVALDPASVSLVWAALREAKHPRIQVPAPVSAVQMEYLAGKKPAAMLEAIRQTVAAARASARTWNSSRTTPRAPIPPSSLRRCRPRSRPVRPA